MRHRATYRRYIQGRTPLKPVRTYGWEITCSCGWDHRVNEGKRQAVRAWKEHAAVKRDDVVVGRVFSARRSRKNLYGEFNDRHVVWVSPTQVQYDSPHPFVRLGRKRPVVSMDSFLRAVVEDVTDLCPPNEWRTDD